MRDKLAKAISDKGPFNQNKSIESSQARCHTRTNQKVITKPLLILKNSGYLMIDVCAAIIERDGLILAARRKEGSHLAGFWEFPGGKVEFNESEEECLARELKENKPIEPVRLSCHTVIN